MANKEQNGESYYFTEKQRFKQWWLWLILFGLLCIPLYGIIKQLVFHVPFGSKPLSDIGLLAFGLGMLLFCIFFRIMLLSTIINKKFILIRFYPFVSKQILWHDISEASLITYGFVGYGIKLWTPYGTVYNIAGRWGLSLLLKNGKKYLVGTQKPDEIRIVLEKIKLKV